MHLHHSTTQDVIQQDKETIVKQFHKIEDQESGWSMEFRLRLSQHSRKRAQQRGIRPDDIAMAMTYGEFFQKQGLCFYVVCETDLPEELDLDAFKRLRHLVVITNGKTNCLVTCYKNANALRQIRKKRNELVKMAS